MCFEIISEPVHCGLVPDILSTTDNCVILGRSYSSCINHSTMSLTDEVKDTDLDRLRKGCGGGDNSLKLNSSWHLSGSGYVSKEYIRPRPPEGLSLDSSHSSSQASYLDMFPDATAESMPDTKRPHLMLSISRDDNIENSNDSTAKFYMASEDSPVLGESARTTLATHTTFTNPVFLAEDSTNSAFSSKVPTKPGFPSQDLTKLKIFSKDLKNGEFFSEDRSKQSEDTEEGIVQIGLNNTQPVSEELLSDNIRSVTSSESLSSLVFVFPETVNLPSPLSAEQFATEYYASQSSQLQRLSSQLQSPEMAPLLQTQASPSRKVVPLKSKPTDLVIVAPQLRHSTETCTKSPLPSLMCQTPEQTNRKSEGTPTPDDGYSSSLNSAKLALQSSVGRTFELLPSRLEKNFQNYGTQSRHDGENLDAASRVSGEMQSSSNACLSKTPSRTELGTPTGIVHRLKSEITLRELSQRRPLLSPLSPNKEFSKEMLRSSLSQPCKDSISKTESFQRSESSPLPPQYHSQTVPQNETDKSCREDPIVSPETHNSRSAFISTRSRQGCTREVVSDPGVQGYRGSLKSSEPLTYSQALLRETRRCKTQLDSLNHTPETDTKYPSINSETGTLHSHTSPLRTSTGKSDRQTSRTSDLKTPLVTCSSLPLKSLPVTPSLASENPAQATPMDYQALNKSTLQSSENTTAERRSSLSKDLLASTADNKGPTDGRNVASVATDSSAPNDLEISPTADDDDDDAQKQRSTKRRLCNSEPKIVTSNSSQHEIERTRSDISGIASKTTEPDEERLNEANKENISRYPLLKRISGMVQSSTPEKQSKRCKESVDCAAETGDDDVTPKSPEIQKMSVKNRDWHKELLEEYTKPSPSSSTTSTASSSTQTKTATKKPSQRLAVLAPKISYTPMPIQAYQGSSSKLSKGTDKLQKS